MSEPLRRPEKAKVRFSPLLHEWFVYYQGEATWFLRWVDAYSHAYTVVRVRNVAADAMRNLT